MKKYIIKSFLSLILKLFLFSNLHSQNLEEEIIYFDVISNKIITNKIKYEIEKEIIQENKTPEEPKIKRRIPPSELPYHFRIISFLNIPLNYPIGFKLFQNFPLSVNFEFINISFIEFFPKIRLGYGFGINLIDIYGKDNLALLSINNTTPSLLSIETQVIKTSHNYIFVGTNFTYLWSVLPIQVYIPIWIDNPKNNFRKDLYFLTKLNWSNSEYKNLDLSIRLLSKSISFQIGLIWFWEIGFYGFYVGNTIYFGEYTKYLLDNELNIIEEVEKQQINNLQGGNTNENSIKGNNPTNR